MERDWFVAVSCLVNLFLCCCCYFLMEEGESGILRNLIIIVIFTCLACISSDSVFDEESILIAVSSSNILPYDYACINTCTCSGCVYL